MLKDYNRKRHHYNNCCSNNNIDYKPFSISLRFPYSHLFMAFIISFQVYSLLTYWVIIMIASIANGRKYQSHQLKDSIYVLIWCQASERR